MARGVIKAKEGDCREVVEEWPGILEEGMASAGNINTPTAIDSVELLLEYYEKKSEGDPKVWMAMWLKPYLKCLESGDRLVLRGLIEQINPIICRLSPHPVLLSFLLHHS